MRYKKEKISIEYFEEGSVFYSDRSKKFYALDEAGTEIWKYIDSMEEFEISQLVIILSSKYGVDESIITKDLNAFLDKLIKIGALSII
ncbi:MAG: PqqD family protein [Clostridia bacterium]|nr:PqqD family protein [Clostridia bacterium]